MKNTSTCTILLICAIVLLFLGSCMASPEPSMVDVQLQNTTWHLIELNGAEVPKIAGPLPHGDTFRLVFGIQTFAGYTPCNEYFHVGRLTAANGIFAVSEIGKTVMGCGINALENEYTSAMIASRSYRLQAGHLLLADENGRIILRFTAVDR